MSKSINEKTPERNALSLVMWFQVLMVYSFDGSLKVVDGCFKSNSLNREKVLLFFILMLFFFYMDLYGVGIGTVIIIHDDSTKVCNIYTALYCLYHV